MKYIQFDEYESENYDKRIEKIMKIREEREKHPEKYPKHLFPPHNMGGENKGFVIVEATPEQMMNTIVFFRPVMDIKYVPIFESTELIELRQKMKK